MTNDPTKPWDLGWKPTRPWGRNSKDLGLKENDVERKMLGCFISLPISKGHLHHFQKETQYEKSPSTRGTFEMSLSKSWAPFCWPRWTLGLPMKFNFHERKAIKILIDKGSQEKKKTRTKMRKKAHRALVQGKMTRSRRREKILILGQPRLA